MKLSALLALIALALAVSTATANAVVSEEAAPAAAGAQQKDAAPGANADAAVDDDEYEWVDADAADAEADAEAAQADGGASANANANANANAKGKAKAPKKQLHQVWYYPYDGVETVIHGCRRLYKTKSPFQSVEIMDSPAFGRMLLLDNIVMSAEKDEYIYHESLVHPAMAAHPNPRHVMIAGGGELSTAREVLKHKSVERVTLVDIDGAVVEAARRYLAEWGNTKEYLRDPRLTVTIADAFAWLETYSGPALDVVIMDISDPDFGMTTTKEPWEQHYGTGGLQPGQYDPYEAPRMGEPDREIVGPTHPIYQPRFFQLIKSRLAANGIVVTQSTSSTDVSFTWLYSTLCTEFGGRNSHCANVHPYTAHIPSFTALWSFILVSAAAPARPLEAADLQQQLPARCGVRGAPACDGRAPLPVDAIKLWSAESVDAALSARTAAPPTVTPLAQARPPYDQLLRWYDGEAHSHMFALPKSMRQRLAAVVASGFAPISTKQSENKRVYY